MVNEIQGDEVKKQYYNKYYLLNPYSLRYFTQIFIVDYCLGPLLSTVGEKLQDGFFWSHTPYLKMIYNIYKFEIINQHLVNNALGLSSKIRKKSTTHWTK